MAEFNLGRVKGDKGDTGDKGEQGIQGVAGVNGNDGKDGTSVRIIDGVFSPENPLPNFADTNEGDAYVYLATRTTKIEQNQRYDLYIHAYNSSDWLVLNDWGGVPGPQGIKGDTGTTGSAGANGTDGITPNLSIGTVSSTGQNAPTVSITGTTTSSVLNFGLQQGAKGDKGDVGATFSLSGTVLTITV